MAHVVIGCEPGASPRVRFGVGLLKQALVACGLQVDVTDDAAAVSWRTHRPGGQSATPAVRVFVGPRRSAPVADLENEETLLYHSGAPGEDGYYLASLPGRLVVVTGGNDNGVLYGCQELARIVREKGEIPRDLAQGETPDFVIRGPAVGLQKTRIEPPRQTYEYPITPERFPWFYDRDAWAQFLDLLLDQRANVVYLWSGHPFSSFVRLDEYPEALEVSEAELALNREQLQWLVAEADRRGIRLVIKFYNIHIPLPFAQHHGLPLLQTRPSPLVSAYTRAAIAAFVRTYPDVGLMVCLGETLHGDLYGAEWFTQTILAGVNDGVAQAGVAEPPPLILRAHAVDPVPILDRARTLYPRLWTMGKYNGESLTTWTPRGRWQAKHQTLSSLTDVHIVNVHILANLEPFRFGAVSFIQRCVAAMRHRLGARGLHLYPLFYWDWPYAPDRAEPRLRQLDRDWIWFAAWHRYAWKADRDARAERRYWIDQLALRLGSDEAASAALDALEAIGHIAPLAIRRVGITEGNRQTFSLGMTMSQLINAQRYRPWDDLWESHAPQGERIEQYAEREVHGEEHVGETPLDVAEDIEHYADVAVCAIDGPAAGPVKESNEYAAIRNDVHAVAELARFYAHRIRAAVTVCLYREAQAGSPHRDIDRLWSAVREVEASVEHYKRLVTLTDKAYRYANSMQTGARKVPFPDGATYSHWRDCLPLYEEELATFRRNVAALARGTVAVDEGEVTPPPERYRPVPFTVRSSHAEAFTLTAHASVFAATQANIRRVAEELDGLTGIRVRRDEAIKHGVSLEIELSAPAYLLVGYFQSREPVWLQPPSLEEASHADAEGGLEPVLKNAVVVDFHPSVHVHAVRLDAGIQRFDPGKGAYVVAGVVDASQQLTVRDVVHRDNKMKTMDWLFEA